MAPRLVSEAVARRCYLKKGVLKKRKTPLPEPGPATLLKKRLTQVFSCKFFMDG